MKLLQKLVFAVICLLFSSAIFSQSIIEESLTDSSHLDSAQLANYQKFSVNEEFVSLTLIEVQDLEALQDSGRLTINISAFPCSPLTFLVRNVDYIDEDNYTWYGEVVTESDSSCSEGIMFMIAYEGEYFGYIKMDTTEFLYHDLGGGIQILAELDSNTGVFVCGAIRDEEEEFQSVSSEYLEDCNKTSDIRVFAHYTAAARHRYGTMSLKQRIRLAIVQANQALRNSAVQTKIKLVLAGIAFLDDFSETSNMSNDLYEYYNMSVVQSDRTNAEADVAILFCKGDDAGGTRGASYQRGIRNSVEVPYGVVDTKWSTNDDYVFTHEMGHLMNADHFIPYNIPGFNKGHQMWVGWLFNNTRIVTIMHNGDIWWHRRILNFSNPDIYYKKEPTGIEDERDNARAIDDYGYTLANMYTNPVLPVTGVISGYNTACGCKSADYWATAGCGTAPYSYEWQISYDGIYFTTVGTNSDTYQTTLLCNPQIYTLFVRCIITDDNASTAMVQKSVLVLPTWSARTCDAGVITEGKNQHKHLGNDDQIFVSKFYMSLRPQPANNYVMVDLTSGVEGKVSLEFIDLSGRRVKKEDSRSIKQGLNTFKIDISTLSPGVYFIISRTNNTVATQKLIVN